MGFPYSVPSTQATDAEVSAAIAAIINGASSASDTFSEVETLLSQKVVKSANLSDLASVSTSRTNLGLGTGNAPQFDALSLIRGSTPAAVWTYANHLISIRGQESTGGGTICAVGHANDLSTTSYEFTGYRSRGTLASPTAVQNGDRLGRYAAVCYDGSNFGAGGMLDFYAAENWTGSAHGTYFAIRLVDNLTTADRPVFYVDQAGAINLPLSTARISLGANAASLGSLGLPNNSSIQGRNAANNGNVSMIYVDAGNNVRLSGSSNGLTLDCSNGGLRINNQTSGAAAAVGTLMNAPTAGNPAFWLPISIAGTTRYIPCW